jgi:uncharacterized damage-inducible protein DinB
MSTPTQLADDLERAYTQLWQTLSLLDAEELDRPCLHGGWSPKAMLAHIAFWDDYQTLRMIAAVNGNSADDGFPRPVEDNDQRAAADGGRAWDEVTQEADANRCRMIDFARSLREEQLTSYPEGQRQFDLTRQLIHMSRHVRDHAREIAFYCGSLDRWGRAGLRRFVAAQSTNLLDSIGGLSEETITTVPVCGVWTIRDVIAHVASWDEYAVAVVKAWPGVDPSTRARWQITDSGSNDGDAINAQLLADRAHLDAIGVLDDAVTVHRRLLRRFDRCSDDDLNRSGDIGFGLTAPLSYLFFSMAQHTAEHAVDIWTWRVGKA